MASVQKYITVVILILNSWMLSDSANILIYPYGHCLNSHLLNAEKMAHILIGSGHNVSMLVSNAYSTYSHKSHAQTTLSGSGSEHPRLLQFKYPTNFTPVCEYDTMDFMLYTPIKKRFNSLIQTSVMYCDSLLATEGLLQNLKQEQYDLVIVESLDPCSKILADYLDVPFVPMITAGLGHWDGNPRPPSYLPATISPYTSDMSFFQRMFNFIMKNMYETIPLIMGFDMNFEILKEKYGLNQSLSLSETFSRAAIKFVNSDFAIDYPAPIEPDTVMIGGFAVDTHPPALSDELQDFMDSSGEHGVILMSFGTLTKRFSPEWTRKFVDAFSSLPQRVIWRYHPEDDGQLPLELLNNSSQEKIKVMKWLPQASLLKHPKTRLFITHCGLNSMFETTHYGVPVVALPLSGDQMQHAVKLSNHLNMGVTEDIFNLDSDKLSNAIKLVLSEEKYRANAKLVSERILDQPMTASSKILYWVDYVIRHRGAPHLKSRAHKLTWYQYYSIDVITFIGGLMIATLLTLLAGCIKISTFLLSKCSTMFSYQRQKLE